MKPTNNPYDASPYHEDPSPMSGGVVTPGSFETGEAFALVWNVFKKQWTIGSAAALVILSTTVAASFVFGTIQEPLEKVMSYGGLAVNYILTYTFQFLTGFVAAWFGYKAVAATLNNERLRFEAIFESFQQFQGLLALAMIMPGIMLLAALPGTGIVIGIYYMFLESAMSAIIAAFSSGDFLAKEPIESLLKIWEFFTVAWLLIAIAFAAIGLPQLYVRIRLDFAWLLCMERNYDAVEALKESWTLTKGNSMRLVGYYLLWFLIYLGIFPLFATGVVITCMLGIVAYFPLAFLHTLHVGVLYRQLTRHLPPPASKGEQSDWAGPDEQP